MFFVVLFNLYTRLRGYYYVDTISIRPPDRTSASKIFDRFLKSRHGKNFQQNFRFSAILPVVVPNLLVVQDFFVYDKWYNQMVSNLNKLQRMNENAVLYVTEYTVSKVATSVYIILEHFSILFVAFEPSCCTLRQLSCDF
jgi:hypothetical protein